MMTKTPIAAAAAACKVWTRSATPCVFGRSVYELLRTNNGEHAAHHSPSTSSELSQTYHCDRMLVDFEENEDGSVVLTPSTRKTKIETNDKPKNRRIPLGRARDCPTLTRRAFEDDKSDRRRRPFVSLAVVGMVVATEEKEGDSSSMIGTGVSSLLITRRPSYMRSFPGAFVFPGGNVDAEDESLEFALSREIFEETGLVVSEDSWKLECLWESIYPTHLPTLEDEKLSTTADGNEDEPLPDGAIKAHHLVCYFSGRPQNQRKREQKSNTSLNLCREEVDGAVWMSRDNIRDLLEATSLIEADRDLGLPAIVKEQTIVLQTGSSTTNQSKDILLSDLVGIYPRLDVTYSRFCGMAQGSLFALEEFVRNNPTTRIETE